MVKLTAISYQVFVKNILKYIYLYFMLNRISQSQKYKHCIISLTRGSKSSQIHRDKENGSDQGLGEGLQRSGEMLNGNRISVLSATGKGPQTHFLTIHVFLLKLLAGFRICPWERDIRTPDSLEFTAQELHLPTSVPQPVTGGWVQAWGLDHCTPVTRRPLTECLDREGGSCPGEKVFVSKFSEQSGRGVHALSQWGLSLPAAHAALPAFYLPKATESVIGHLIPFEESLKFPKREKWLSLSASGLLTVWQKTVTKCVWLARGNETQASN